MTRTLLLLLAAVTWTWWLGPQQQHAVALPLLLGLTLHVDALRLLFLTLILAVPAPAPVSRPGEAPSRGRRVRLPAWGLIVCRAGLTLTVLVEPTAAQIVGLAIAGGGLALAAWPLGWGRTLTPLLLVPLAISGAFDSVPLPGRPVPILPAGLVVLALLAAAAGAGTWPLAGPVPAGPTDPRPAGGARGAWMAALYGLGCLWPLVLSLQAGPWDPLGRLLVLGAGLLTLGTAACAALGAPDALATERAARHYLAGALLVGLGLATPAAVAGGLVLLLAGLSGLAVVPGPRIPQLAGLAALAGLPPTLGFAGLWLLISAAAEPGLLLVAVAVPVAGLIVALAALRLAPAGAPRAPATWVVGLVLLLAGLVPGPVIDAVLRPALQPLAAGLAALADLQGLPGVGLMVAHGPDALAVWPFWGLAAALILTLALSEALARVGGRLVGRGGGGVQVAPPAELAGAPVLAEPVAGALVPAAAIWACWLDPASLIWLAWLRGTGRPRAL